MADRRMFTKKVTDDDHFLSLSSSAQALYLHLTMGADDDGFNNQVSVCMFKAHASTQDLEALLSNRFVFQFDNGVPDDSSLWITSSILLSLILHGLPSGKSV